MTTYTKVMGSTLDENGSRSGAFEAAQLDLFDEVGLDVRSRFLDLDTPRVQVYAFEAGPTDADEPRVFLHGTAGFGGFLAPLVAQFGDARSIVFDRPGYGLSDPFVYTQGNLRRTVVDVLEGVLNELGIEQADLIGHSMGGHASIRFALTHPERVRKITTIGAIPGFPGTHPPLPLRLVTVPLLGHVIQRLQKSGEQGVLDIAEIFGERDAIREYPALIRALAAHEDMPKAAAAGASEFKALFSIQGWHPTARIGESELATLQQPTKMIWGDYDPLGSPGDVRDGVELIPDVRFETVAAGHIPYLARTEQCAQFIRG